MGETAARDVVTGTDVPPVIRRQRIRQRRDAYIALVGVAAARGFSAEEIDAGRDKLMANAETVGNLPAALCGRVIGDLRRQARPAHQRVRVRRLRSHAVTAAPRPVRVVRTRTRERRSSPAARRASSASSGSSSDEPGPGEPPGASSAAPGMGGTA